MIDGITEISQDVSQTWQVGERNNETAFQSIIGRLSGWVNRITTSDLETTGPLAGLDYQSLTIRFIRSDFENTFALQEVTTTDALDDHWLMEDDILLPFKPRWSVQVKMTMRYAGKLKPSAIVFDDDLLD